MWLQVAFLMEAVLSLILVSCCLQSLVPDCPGPRLAPFSNLAGCSYAYINITSPINRPELWAQAASSHSSVLITSSPPSVRPLKYLPQRCLLPRTYRQVTKLFPLGLPLHLMLSGQIRRFLRSPKDWDRHEALTQCQPNLCLCNLTETRCAQDLLSGRISRMRKLKRRGEAMYFITFNLKSFSFKLFKNKVFQICMKVPKMQCTTIHLPWDVTQILSFCRIGLSSFSFKRLIILS